MPDDEQDDWELTLESFLRAQLIAENHDRESLAWRHDEGLLSDPIDLENRIAPRDEQRYEVRASQCYGLAMRYRHLLEHCIELFGGTLRVQQHLHHLQECKANGQLPGPLPPVVDPAVAREVVDAVTLGSLR